MPAGSRNGTVRLMELLLGSPGDSTAGCIVPRALFCLYSSAAFQQHTAARRVEPLCPADNGKMMDSSYRIKTTSGESSAGQVFSVYVESPLGVLIWHYVFIN